MSSRATRTGPRTPRDRFDQAVYALVRRVPAGRVVTYGRLAVLAGAPRAARAVGGAMRRCPAGVPWHRVVNAHGGISLRANVGGMVSQRLLLGQEGVRFVRGRVDIMRYLWPSHHGPVPRPWLIRARPRVHPKVHE